MIALLTLSCAEQGPVEALKACSDAECRTSTVEAAYEAAPEDVMRWMSALSDPVVQAALLDQLTYRFPEDARALCSTVPTDQQTKNRCARRNVRPHLFQNPGGLKSSKLSKANMRAASGPRSSDLPVPASAAASWDGVVAPPVDCRQQGTALCALNAALEAAEAGEEDAVIAAHCRRGSPDDERAYGECLFKASEVVGEHHATAGIPTAMALCSDSIFGPMCVAHLLTRASPPVPAADAFTAAEIDAASATAQAFQALEHGALYADRFWASWVYTSYSIAKTVHGGLLDHLPSQAWHHVPVAAAYQQLSQHVPRQLSEAVQALSAALEQRGPMAQASSHHQAVTRMQRHLWEQDWPGEEIFPSTWVMGPSRRVIAADSAAVELQLAVLEAAAQLPTPPSGAFFFSVLNEPDLDQRVRWTAARIGAALDTEAAAQLTDSDPLVAARLSNTNNQRKHPPPPATDRQPPQSADAN